MPESVTDRPTRSHEQVFLLTKAERYFYDADAIREPPTMSTVTGNTTWLCPDCGAANAVPTRSEPWPVCWRCRQPALRGRPRYRARPLPNRTIQSFRLQGAQHLAVPQRSHAYRLKPPL